MSIQIESSFMQPEIRLCEFTNYEDVDRNEYVVPSDSYHPQEIDTVLETGFGILCRMSASGYMDCTEWAHFDSYKEAYDYLIDQYGADQAGVLYDWEAQINEYLDRLKVDAEVSDFKMFADLCRYNSGKAMCDSGGESGRHWQKPSIEKSDTPAVFCFYDGVPEYGVMETAHFLTENLEVVRDIQEQFVEYSTWKENAELPWVEVVANFMELTGRVQGVRDNTYNGENDLTQDYIYETWHLEEPSDWIYDDALCVIQIHTGADVRGGYSSPIFCKSKSDYSVPIDITASYYVSEGVDTDGNDLDYGVCHDLGEKWDSGYSNCPFEEMIEGVDLATVERIKDEDGVVVRDQFKATLKSGEIVIIGINTPHV